jgi:hypothetical protein
MHQAALRVIRGDWLIVVDEFASAVRAAMGDGGAHPLQHRALDPMPLFITHDTGETAHELRVCGKGGMNK